jgi:hypothetical protein
MARYPALFSLGIKIGELHASLQKVLEGCNLNMIYDTPEYVMAREVPGKVPFPKLVTVEVLIDRTTATPDAVQLKLVVKNEELPLQSGNHCAQMFDRINKAINAGEDWTVLESFTGEEESR